MNYATRLRQLENPIRVGVIGAGFFGTHLIHAIGSTPGMETAMVCDIETDKSVKVLKETDVPADAIKQVDNVDETNAAIAAGQRVVTTDGSAATKANIDVIVEATGNPNIAAFHCFKALTQGTHVINVSVEADTVCGQLFARLAKNNGVTYSLASGDQHGQIVNLCEWAGACGLEVVAAGSAEFELDHHGTPDDSIERWPRTFSDAVDPNPWLYNTFLDGTKASVELVAAANALGLRVDKEGFHEPELSVSQMIDEFRPTSEGGILSRTGVVDGVIPKDADFSVFIVTRTHSDQIAEYFADRSNVLTSTDGQYQMFYRPHHFGMETTVTIASVVLHGEPAGVSRGRTAEVVGAAKKDLDPGDEIDDPGGYTVYGTAMDAEDAVEAGYVPFELLTGAEVVQPVSQDEYLTTDHVDIDTDKFIYHAYKLQEALSK